MYISYRAPFHCKQVFKGEFYLGFVSFGIGTNNHIEYGIGHNLLSMRSNGLLLCGQVTEGATYRLD